MPSGFRILPVPCRLLPLLLALVAAPAGAQNLLANPDFDADLSGWQASLFWVAHTADAGHPQPGAVRLESSDCCTVQLHQCLPASPGEAFDFGARLRLGAQVPGEPGDGIGLDVAFFDAADCGGIAIGGSTAQPPVGRNWALATGSSGVAPPGTASAWLRVRQYNFAAVPMLVSFADSVYLVPAGTAGPLFGSGFEG